MKLTEINLKIIPDSRNHETLEAELVSGNLSGIASVPSGKSRGIHEAAVSPPREAFLKFESIKGQILAASVNKKTENQESFDNFLISLDGTPNKGNLGGNLILALSLAFARLKAKSEDLELFRYIRSISQLLITNYQLPRPFFNMINGGAHSGFLRESALNPRQSAFLDFQEFQIIPEVQDFGIALGLDQEFYEKLKEILEKKFSKENVSLGDEAGFSCPFENNEEALEILSDLISKQNYPFQIGLDFAANQYYQRADSRGLNADSRRKNDDGYYLVNDKKYSPEELKGYYLKLIDAYNIFSVEDPFNEEAFDEFAKLTQNLSQNRRETLVITDDLTTTNPERLKTAIQKKSANVILIKPNQIGTLTETLKVVRIAYENNWRAVVSHRSGETMDDFIADLAVAVNAFGIKSGAPAKPERLSKYQRLLNIKQAL